MLIAEAVLLFALDEEKGTLGSGVWIQIDSTLGGALLLDLVCRRRIDISGDAEPAAFDATPMKPGRLVIRDASLTGNQVLDDVLQRLDKAVGKQSSWAIAVAAKGSRDALLEQLNQAGLVSRDRQKVWGLFPRTVWPAANVQPETQLRARVLAVLDDGAAPDELSCCLISLLQAAGILDALFPAADRVQRKARAARAKEVAATLPAGQWVVAATAAAIQASLVG